MHTLPGWVSSKAVRTSTTTPTRYGSVAGSMRPTNVSSLQAIWCLEAKLEPQFTCVKTNYMVEGFGHSWDMAVTVGHGWSRPRPFTFPFGRFLWSRLVTVGHGWSRPRPFTFPFGRFLWSRLVTVGHGQSWPTTEAKHESQSFKVGTQSTKIGSSMTVGRHGFRNSANA